MDCKSGYWQIKMDKESISLTAFSTPQGHYEWIVMPFDLKNAPLIFQRRMDNIFKDLNHCFLVYIDDILVFSKTIEQHKDDVLAVTQGCIDHGIILGKNKCIYAKQEIEFLRLEIKSGQIILQKHILEKTEKFPEKIEDRKQLEVSWMSHLCFRFHQRFSKIKKTITTESQKGSKLDMDF